MVTTLNKDVCSVITSFVKLTRNQIETWCDSHLRNRWTSEWATNSDEDWIHVRHRLINVPDSLLTTMALDNVNMNKQVLLQNLWAHFH